MSQKLLLSINVEKTSGNVIENFDGQNNKLTSEFDLKELLINADNFKLDINRDGVASISINGTPINGVMSLGLNIEVGKIPELSIKLMVV